MLYAAFGELSLVVFVITRDGLLIHIVFCN